VAAVALVGCESDMTHSNFDGGGGGACTAGATRCHEGDVQICKANASGVLGWEQRTVCYSGCQVSSSGVAECVDAPSCTDSRKNQDETDVDCGGTYCSPCGQGKKCKNDTDCQSGACIGGVCKLCKAGTTGCHGNFVQTCKADNSGWDTIKTCDPTKGEVCNPTTGNCEPSQPIGQASPTGTYYLFSMFKNGQSEFKGYGYDVDSYVDKIGDSDDNLIYVNRSMQLDVYRVKLEDSDKDGKMEPHQHPDNPKQTGPVEARKLTFVKTYTNVQLGQPSVGEIFAAKDRIYFLKRDTASSTYNLFEFIFKTGQTNVVIQGNPQLPLCVVGYDETNKRWFAGYNSSVRRVWAYYPKNNNGWAVAFDYPNLAGSHMDGMEVIYDPKTKTPYVYVSDMTSDFLGQYYLDKKTGKWVQKNLFEYKETENQYVEGMGFGAFQHFWATSGQALYEVGGGDLQKYVGPTIE
jgi:hypothetical protein